MKQPLKDAVDRVRRDHVVSAAIKVFGEKGFRGASIRDLAKEAGMADGTIYNIFDSKLDILLAILDPLSDRTVRQPVVDEARLDVRAHLARRLDTFRGETLAMMRVLLSEALVDDEVRAEFLEAVIRPMLAPSVGGKAAYATTAAMLGMILLRLLGDAQPADEQTALASLADALHRSLKAGGDL